MEKKENQKELEDLPEDCIEEILKTIKTRLHRNDARLVCRFWRRLIDRDSSSECYLVNRRTTKHNDNSTQPEFRNFIAEFLNFNRQKISFRFEGMNLDSTEHFWNEKGVHIIGLNFDNKCTKIPLEHVFSKCSRLREMYIHYSTADIIKALKSLATKELHNFSLNFITIKWSCTLAGETTVKMVFRLLRLINKVFPRMIKVTLRISEDIIGLYEELSKFVQLKYELDLKTKKCRVVFDSSSKTPVSFRTVNIDNWTMLPHEYYTNLEEITYNNESGTFLLSQLENVFSQYPALHTLHIWGGSSINDLRKPLANRLKKLSLTNWHWQTFTVSPVFLDTFQFLKKLNIFNMSYTSFVDVVLNMRHLEHLQIDNSMVVADDGREINDVPEVLGNENLKKLTIPSSYLPYTGTTYRFGNLTAMNLSPDIFEENPVIPNVDEVLRRFQCPNLKCVEWFLVEMATSKNVDSLWLKNVMLMFPKLKRFNFRLRGSDRLITEDQKLGLRQICPKISIIDRRISKELIMRELFCQ